MWSDNSLEYEFFTLPYYVLTIIPWKYIQWRYTYSYSNEVDVQIINCLVKKSWTLNLRHNRSYRREEFGKLLIVG